MLYEQMVIIMILSVLVSIVFGAFGESIGIGFLAFIPSMLVMGGVGALWALLNRHGNLLILTDKRCTLERGILSRATSEVRHTDVRNIQVTRGFIDRLFNIGTLGISTAAQSDVEIAIKGIDEPYRIRDLIDGYHG